MLDIVKDFLRTIGLDERTSRGGAGGDPRIAAAAILFHVAGADGRVAAAELASLRGALEREFALAPPEAERIAAAGEAADSEAVDLFHFTSVLVQALDENERARFVGLLWQVAYADGRVHELEDNTVWRVAELLGVSTRERMLAKRAAAGAAGGAPGRSRPTLEAER